MTRALVVPHLMLLLAGVAGRAGWADEPTRTPEEVATLLQAAHATKDDAKVQDWAAKDVPDPWLVADALLARGAREAAEAFAKASPRKDLEGLPAFVAGWRATEGDAAARRALETGNAALLAKKPPEALAAFDSAGGETMGVIPVRLAHGRGLALRALRRYEEAGTRFREVVTAAEALGWLSRAAGALSDLAWTEMPARHPEAGVAAARRLVDLEVVRANRAGTVKAHGLVASLESMRGGNDAAIASLERALEVAGDAVEPSLFASVLYELAHAHGVRGEAGDWEKSLELHLRVQKVQEGLGNRLGAANALANAANANWALGRGDAAKEQAERVVVLAKELGDARLEGKGSQLLGEVAEFQKKPEEALAAYTAAVALFEAAGERVEAARTRGGAAEASRLLGDLPKAREQADRAQKDGEALRDPGIVAYALLVGARIRKDQGQSKEALGFARQALETYRSIGNQRGVAEMEAMIRELEAASPR